MQCPFSIAIIGGGPSALFMYKRLVELGLPGLKVDIYEKGGCLGVGMPYSSQGAADEHITNVSGNEIPELVTTVEDWVKSVSQDTLNKYNIDPKKFNDYKVLPRLLFGQYLTAQFKLLQEKGNAAGLVTTVHYNTTVVDIIDHPVKEEVKLSLENGATVSYDRVVICTGHIWPKKHEGKINGWFDSPYPPAKIAMHANHPVAVRGASLTAIDAIRTLARHNGVFEKNKAGKLEFKVNANSRDFRMVMHSRNGLLPAVRFHLEDSHLGKDTVLSPAEVAANRAANEGFLSLDYVFEKNFKSGIQKNDPEYFAKIKDLNMEDFVNHVMEMRERQDPFELLKAEYAEAERSIERRESVYWKEMLAILSFAMNYPAKYFSAEDRLRLQQTLMPLIAMVIAFVPQSSAEVLMALHESGRLTMATVGDDSTVEPAKQGGAIYTYTDEAGKRHEDYYETFIDCIGQPHLSFEQFPYSGLTDARTVTRARLRFRDPKVGQQAMAIGNEPVVKDPDGNYYLIVPGVAINDNFQVVDAFNALNDRIYIMAVPFIGGYNPDYSGLDFCEAASAAIVQRILGTDLAKAV